MTSSSKKKAERHTHVRERAYELARTGSYRDWLSIESAIRNEGYPEARTILDDQFIRDELDEICRIAQSAEETENRELFKNWLTDFVEKNIPVLKQEFPSATIQLHQDHFSVFTGSN